MLARVDLSPGNITVQQGVVEQLPFDDDTFDLVTAYSFLDHLADHVAMIREAFRVLKPGGMLYVDLIPNRSFWNAVYSQQQTHPGGPSTPSSSARSKSSSIMNRSCKTSSESIRPTGN